MEQIITKSDSLFTQYHGVLEGVPESARPNVEQLTAKAMGYVWGWQDAGGADRNSVDAMDFAYAFGIHAARFESAKAFTMMPIQDAFSSWRKHGDIRSEWWND